MVMGLSMQRPGYFNPRSPCGERPDAGNWIITDEGFQSTLSLRRATWEVQDVWTANGISIHALLAESDLRGVH